MINSFEDLKKFIPNIDLKLKTVIDKYGIHIPKFYASLIDFSNPNDPLFKIVVPSCEELNIKDDELDDPIGDNSLDLSTLKTSMLIHRYPDRALILTTNKCGGRCRYCFRKSKVFSNKEIFDENELKKSLKYIFENKTLNEVILSGGDPLCMPRDMLEYILNFIIEKCPHIKGVRIHTRCPVYNPFVITDELALFLNNINKKIPLILMTHIVHCKEVSFELKNALDKLDCIKINQAVLLKGVNDTVDDLKNLSWALVNVGILPHYLHFLDKAKGISHFKVSINKARELINSLHGHLSGHLIPKLILDMPNGIGKIMLNKSFIVSEDTSCGHKISVKSTYSDIISDYKE